MGGSLWQSPNWAGWKTHLGLFWLGARSFLKSKQNCQKDRQERNHNKWPVVLCVFLLDVCFGCVHAHTKTGQNILHRPTKSWCLSWHCVFASLHACRHWLCHQEDRRPPASDESDSPEWRQVWNEDPQHLPKLRSQLHRGWGVWGVHKGTGQPKGQGRTEFVYS